MSAIEVSIKWKERSDAQSASGTSKKGTTSAVFFARMNFSPIPHDRIRPSLRGLKRILTEIRAARRTKCSTRLTRWRIFLTKLGTAEAAYGRPCVRMIFLAPINQYAKRSRNRLSLRMRILLRWSRSRTKIRGGQKKVVRLWIETHCFGAKLGIDRFDFRELVR